MAGRRWVLWWLLFAVAAVGAVALAAASRPPAKGDKGKDKLLGEAETWRVYDVMGWAVRIRGVHRRRVTDRKNFRRTYWARAYHYTVHGRHTPTTYTVHVPEKDIRRLDVLVAIREDIRKRAQREARKKRDPLLP